MPSITGVRGLLWRAGPQCAACANQRRLGARRFLFGVYGHRTGNRTVEAMWQKSTTAVLTRSRRLPWRRGHGARGARHDGRHHGRSDWRRGRSDWTLGHRRFDWRGGHGHSDWQPRAQALRPAPLIRLPPAHRSHQRRCYCRYRRSDHGWHPRCRSCGLPPPGNPLSEADTKTLPDWIMAGAPNN